MPSNFTDYDIQQNLQINILKIWEVLPSGERIRLDIPQTFDLF